MPAHKKYKRSISGLRNLRRLELVQNEEVAPSATALSEVVMIEPTVQMETAAVPKDKERPD